MNLSYPIGEFAAKPVINESERQALIASLAETPTRLQAAIAGLTQEQLETPYRPEGWTVRQTVHHLADSQVNGYIRFKLGLTEETPTIKPYAEKLWAELADGQCADTGISLQLLDAVHQRWTFLLHATPSEAFARQVRHPEYGEMSLDTVLQLYEWHARHHLAHITSLRLRQHW